MPTYYPAFLDLNEKLCVVIGGGDVAERKVNGLLGCGAKVTVVSPTMTLGLESLVEDRRVSWKSRGYRTGDLKGSFLAIAATDQEDVNQSVAEEASGLGILLNVADVPSLCNFIAPSVVQRGEVTVAISTGGASPALARKLRQTLESSELLAYAELATILTQARNEMKRRNIQVNPDRWQSCINSHLVDLVRVGRDGEALETLIVCLMEQT
jgi:precorrin-2 dehydrogenase/sirohydrochlorin ferrochelatase